MRKGILPAVLISILVSTSVSFLIIQILETEYKVEPLKLSEWGDYIGGVYGTIFSFLGLVATIIASVFVYQTLDTQKKQLQIQTETETYNRISSLIIKKTDSMNSAVDASQLYGLSGWNSILNLAFRGDENTWIFDEMEDGNSVSGFAPYPFFDLTHSLRSDICRNYELFESLIHDKTANLSSGLQRDFQRTIYFQNDVDSMIFLLTKTNEILEERIEIFNSKSITTQFLLKVLYKQNDAISTLKKIKKSVENA